MPVNFKKDLKDFVLSQLDYYEVKYKKNDDLLTLLTKYFTFSSKYIVPQRRTVNISIELSEQMVSLPVDTQKALLKLINWVNNGVDINCFQSGGLYGYGSRDYQNTLYGIVHLHLSASEDDVLPVIKKGRMAKRGKYLLFALFVPEKAYFIDVIEHPEAFTKNNTKATEWTSANMLRIIENNWPDLLASKRIDGISMCNSHGEPVEQTDADIATLTANHINTFVAGKDGIYSMKPGITTSGDSVEAVMSAQKEIGTAKWWEKEYNEHKESIHTALQKVWHNYNIEAPSEFDIHYDYVESLNRHIAVERCTGVAIDLDSRMVYPLQ